MGRFKKLITLMLVVVLSMTSLSAVQGAEDYEGQDGVESMPFMDEEDVEITPEPEEIIEYEEEFEEPDTTVTPETIETPAPTAEVPEITVTPNVARNAKSTGVAGWNGSGNRWRYFKANSSGTLAPLSGWNDIGGKRFYFDPSDDNHAASGFKEIAGRAYLFGSTGGAGTFGAMALGWQKSGGKDFYFRNTGNNVTRGEMLTGWQTISGRVYYFSTDKELGTRGSLALGWVKIGKNSFYFSKAAAIGKRGSVLEGWHKLSYVDNKGKTRKGTFYLNKASAMGSKGRMRTGWVKISGKRYYMNKQGLRQAKKWVKIKNAWYYFNKKGVALSGWKYVGGLKYYFNPKNNKLSQDVRKRVKGPYRATINRSKNVVVIYARDGAKGYTIPVKVFTCSVGREGTPTPTGRFNTSAKYRWKSLMGPSWGQYATRIVGGILFHSVSGPNKSIYSLPAAQYNLLGGPASAGCVRLTVRDAKWIYDNCQLGMQVTISDTAYVPFDKPKPARIPASQNWDPTDPAVKR